MEEKIDDNEKISSKKFLYYAFILVAILILGTVTATYAFFQAETTSTTAKTTIIGSTDCIDVTFESTQNGQNEGITGLDIKYPVTDNYALANIKPVVVKVINKCSAERQQDPVNYTLTLSTFSKEVTNVEGNKGYITDDKIRVKVVEKDNISADGSDEDEITDTKNAGYLDTVLSKIEAGKNNKKLLADHFQTLKDKTDAEGNKPFEKFDYSTYTTKTDYVIDTGSVASGKTNEYNIYLWVDYYEGYKAAYNESGNAADGEVASDENSDKKTEEQKFESIISLIVNSTNE